MEPVSVVAVVDLWRRQDSLWGGVSTVPHLYPWEVRSLPGILQPREESSGNRLILRLSTSAPLATERPSRAQGPNYLLSQSNPHWRRDPREEPSV